MLFRSSADARGRHALGRAFGKVVDPVRPLGACHVDHLAFHGRAASCHRCCETQLAPAPAKASRISVLTLARNAYFRTASPRVSFDLPWFGKTRLAGDDIEYRLFAARADRKARRARTAVRERGERLLDDAILQRVVRDRDQRKTAI